MRLLFVADGRSPIALNWIGYFVERGHEVHLASTFPCAPNLRLRSLRLAPAAFSGLGEGGNHQEKKTGLFRRLLPVAARTHLRQWLGPLTLPSAARRLRKIIDEIQPDLVHAMRIPYEGMLAALAAPEQPLLVSVWGNDFTLHAPATPWMGYYTRNTLHRLAALHTDCRRDLRLAQVWGFPPDHPALVVPGNGGVQLDVFHPEPSPSGRGDQLVAHPVAPIIINPRGLRLYVRNDTFFQAIPLVLEKSPQVRFVCPAMQGERQAIRWVEALDVAASVDLLPPQGRPAMAALFRRARVAVSLTEHDGTPNTLLEAMACGCFPIAGDLESIREWIVPGVNGLLVEPGDPRALAEAILLALGQPGLRQRAREHNLRLVADRADYNLIMDKAEEFYRSVTGS